VQARRVSGYRSSVSQEPRRPHTRNATAVATSPSAAVADDTPDYPRQAVRLADDGAGVGRADGQAADRADRRLAALLADCVQHHRARPLRERARPALFRRAVRHTLALYTFEVYLLTAISGLTIGKRLLGIRTIRTNGGNPGFKWAALRTLLLLFVIPACLTDRDMRGLHDRAADTIVVRL